MIFLLFLQKRGKNSPKVVEWWGCKRYGNSGINRSYYKINVNGLNSQDKKTKILDS